MKNSKTDSLTIAHLPQPGENQRAASAETCVNLRRVKGSDKLAPAQNPAPVPGLEQLPFAVVNHKQQGKIALFENNNYVYSLKLSGNGTPQQVGALPGKIRSAVVIDNSRVSAMTTRGPVTIVFDYYGEASFATPGSRFPKLRFKVVDEYRLSARVGERSLSGAYDGRSGELNDADVERLTRDSLAAYDRLCFAALSDGASPQPILARYRLVGHRGETLYKSVPVLLTSSEGFGCTGLCSIRLSNQGSYREASEISTKAFRFAIENVDDYPADVRREVDKLIIETSIPIHPVDFDGYAYNRLATRVGTGDTIVEYYVPGCSVRMGDTRALAMSRLESVVSLGDHAFRPAHVIHHPFVSGFDIDLEIAPPKAFGDYARKHLEALKADIDLVERHFSKTAALCSAPHGFTAGCAANIGNFVVWGNVTPLPFAGYSIEELSVECAGDSEWDGEVIVNFSDGQRYVRATHGTGAAPTKLSPFISYPSSNATSIEVMLTTNGHDYYRKFPLTPSKADNCAYFIAADAVPVTLDESEPLVVPSEIRHDDPLTDTLLIAPVSDPLQPISDASPSLSTINAIFSVDRRGGAWEYSRNRIYIFTDTGTWIANITDAGAWKSFNRFDHRRVAGPSAVCETSHDRYPLMAIAGGDLIGLSRGTVTTLLPDIRARDVAWDDAHGELWAANSLGEVEAYSGSGPAHFTYGDFTVDGMRNFDGMLFAATDEGVLSTSMPPARDELIDVSYSLTVDLPPENCRLSFRRLRAFALNLDASRVEGEVTVWGDRMLLGQMQVNGPVNNQLAALTIAFPTSTIKMRVACRLSPDARLSSVKMLL